MMRPRAKSMTYYSKPQVSWDRSTARLHRHGRRRPAIRALRCRYQQKARMAARSLCPGLSRVVAIAVEQRPRVPTNLRFAVEQYRPDWKLRSDFRPMKLLVKYEPERFTTV